MSDYPPRSERTAADRTTLDQVFDALGHAPRRVVLSRLADHPPDAERPSDGLALDESFDDAKRRLYHVHLPKLDRMQFVDWDAESEVVRRGPRFEDVEPVLGLLDDHSGELPDSWP